MKRIMGRQPFIINSQTKQESQTLHCIIHGLLHDKLSSDKWNFLLFLTLWYEALQFVSFLPGLYSSQGFVFFEGHRKFKTNLPIIVLHGIMFTNDPCAQFWPQNLSNFDGLAKLGHFGHFGYFGHQREFLWPLGQRPFCLAQILYLIKYILPDEYYKGQVSWFLTERWHAIRSSRKSSWKLSS